MKQRNKQTKKQTRRRKVVLQKETKKQEENEARYVSIRIEHTNKEGEEGCMTE